MEEFKNNSNASKEERLPGPSKVTPITTNVKVKNNQNDKKPFRKFCPIFCSFPVIENLNNQSVS